VPLTKIPTFVEVRLGEVEKNELLAKYDKIRSKLDK